MAAVSYLLSAISKMYVTYLPEKNLLATCQITNAYSPAPSSSPRPTCSAWTKDYGIAQATAVLASVTTQVEALRLLRYIAQFGGPISGVPSIQACVVDLGLTDVEYANLWDGVGDSSFCKVKIPQDASVTYYPITRVQKLVENASAQGAVGVIINAYRDAISVFNPESMRLTCNSVMTYANMTGPLEELCGCYMDVQNVDKFTTDEKSFLAQNPQCLPSCLAAAVRFIKGVGGPPQVCNQNICIADNINVSGAATSITQVCPQCPKRQECVCYVHINGQTLDNQTCNTVYTVDDKGTITSTTHNTGPAPGQGIRSAWDSLLHSGVALWVLVGAVVVIVIGVMALLISRALRGRTTSKRRSIRGSSPISYQQELGPQSTELSGGY